MDTNLLKSAIEYHGKQLYSKICEQNQDEMLKLDNTVFIDSLRNHETKSDDFSDEISLLQSPNESNLYNSMLNFIAKKSKYLFNEEILEQKKCKQNENHVECDEELYPTLPSIEKFMNVPALQAKSHFFKYLEVDDVVIANITAIADRGLYAKLICFDSITNKKRELEYLKIVAFCSINDLQDFAGVKALMNLFQYNDLIRCVIKSVDLIKETCDIWFHVPDNLKETKLKLGLVSTSECPIYYHNSIYYEKHPALYGQLLKREKSFNNSASIDLLAKRLKLNISPKVSFMKGLSNYEIKSEEMASELRKTQTRNLALQSVARGIKLLKENQSDDAMLHFNKALTIDEDNVEGLVARGALFANNSDFTKAITDLEKALKLDPKHSNAKKYLKEVFNDRAISLEKSESYDEAIEYYKKLLDFDDLEAEKIKLINLKINQLEEKKRILKSKSYYGPQMPTSTNINTSNSKNHDKKKRKRSNSVISVSSSSSTSSSSSSSSSSSKKSKSKSKQQLPVSSRNEKILHDKKDNHYPERRTYYNNRSNLNRSYTRRSRSRSRRRSLNDSRTHERERVTNTSQQYRENKTIQRKDDKPKTKNEEEEDLEAFYNKLKQNAATKTKK